MIARTILYSLRAETNDVAPKFQKFEAARQLAPIVPAKLDFSRWSCPHGR